MFSRRRKAASNPPLNGANANPAATTAATSAFLRNQASNASLSSAAAATALRSRPTTPISVADVQTKRTIRRSGSTSSMGSSVNGSQRGGRPSLERRGSSGSMTERTFRDPSPGRPVPSAADAPPVPAIPQNIHSAGTSKSHRRAASLETTSMRVASPPPNQATGRGSSLGPGAGTAVPRRAQRSSNLSSVSELTSDSRGSVNFSYPTNLRPASPITQRRLTSPSPSRNSLLQMNSSTNQNLIYDPNTRSFLPAAEIHAIEHKLYEAANAPVKKKKRVPPGNATGSHLAQGTVGGKPRGTAIDAMEAAAKPTPQPVLQSPTVQPVVVPAPISELSAEPAASSQVKRKKKKQVVINDSDSDQASYVAASSDNDSDVPTSRARVGTALAKKPSVVREDREREEEEDDTPRRITPANTLSVGASPAGRDISPTPLPRSKAGRGHGKIPDTVTPAYDQVEEKVGPSGLPTHATPDAASPTGTAGLSANGTVPVTRMPSLSPGRSAHFATTPDSLVVKHQPPQRSISPRKSALKHSNSRGSSPVPVASSEASNSPVAPEEQLSIPRKKAVRVSFDETNVGIGQAATPVLSDSPISQSPQVAKRPWYSIGRGKKKEQAAADEDDDEIMKPRPALPSFGSVRERKHRDVEERPLIKPAEPVEDKQPIPSPLFTSPAGEINEIPLGLSKDHVVGAVLAQDATTKNAANISKSREPLPPQVTSVEGSGYHSDTDSSVSAMETSTPASVNTEPEIIQKPQEEKAVDNEEAVTHPTPNREEDTPTPTQDKSSNGQIPQIAVSQATPTLDETARKEGWPNVPGGWESSTSDSGIETPRASLDELIETTPAAFGTAAPIPNVQIRESPRTELEHHQKTPAIMEEAEESDAASVYSDAAEDFSDGGDGFQSLDAVVESPVVNSAPGLAIPTPPESPTRTVKERAYQKSDLSKKSSAPDLNEGWDKAQEYWKGLSADKKRQLELEAMQEDDDGSDTEVEAKPAPKQRQKKKDVKPVPAPISIVNERTYMIQPGSKAGPAGHTTLRSSMRAEPPIPVVDTKMRKSMRVPQEQPQGTMRASMRGPPVSSTQKQARPVSLPVEPKTGSVANKHSRTLSSASAAAASDAARRDMQPPAPALRRRGSGDSDSSFKRAKSSHEMTMRRSMRRNSGSGPIERPQSPGSRFSLRSLSPTGSFRRPSFSNAPKPAASSQNHMRSSMRGNQASTPTLRGNAPTRSKSPSTGIKMPGFGRANKNVKSQKPVRARASRFADSSDEEVERPAFRSRFIDSSDDSDDEPAQRTAVMPRTMRNPATAPALSSSTVRGIPKALGVEDGDSSDLSDSDDEKATSPGIKLQKKRVQNGTPPKITTQGATLASGSLRRSGSGRGTLELPVNTTTVSAPPMRPAQKRRGSIISILRRKKNNTDKVRKSDAESPARRDTPLERSKADLQALKSDQPTSPRLQKRNPLSRENSSQWPLKNQDVPPDDGRPFTADAGNGVTGSEATVLNSDETNLASRPDIGTRRFTATGLGEVDSKGINGTALGDGKKKKKFGALRKLFKLND